MTKYFSAATCSFYDTDVFPENNLPEDCVIVEEETYKNLMEQQNAGFVIVPDSDGNPSVMSQSCGSCHCTVHEKTVATKEQLGHVKIDGETLALNENGELTVVGGGGGSGLNVGDIFYTSRLDTELNGAVEANGAVYSVADFTGKQSVPELLRKGNLPFVSMSEYESIVSANGSCRAFGWDNGDTFRVPTVKALLLTKEQAAVVGNGMTLGVQGLNGQTGGLNMGSGATSAGISNYGKESGSTTGNDGMSIATLGITTDPEKSGVVANLDVIEYRAMVQISTGATDEALMTCTGVLADVADLKQSKASADASNFSAEGIEKIVGWGMPDWNSRISIATNYTFTRKGYLLVWQHTISGQAALLNGQEILRSEGGHSYLGANYNSLFIPVDIGDTLTGTITGAIFMPCKGV